MAAFLLHVGRGEVNGDVARRQRQPQRRQRPPHPLARLGDRLVRQSDDMKRRQPGDQCHLGLYVDDLDTVKRHPADTRGHKDGSCCFYREFSQDGRAMPVTQADSVAARFALTSAAPGGMAERSKAHAWKVCIRATVSWVRIPLPPPSYAAAIRR